MKRRSDKDLTREELIEKLKLTRRKLRLTEQSLRMRQDEIMDIRRAEYERMHPGPTDQSLHANFEDLPNGNLAMRFSRAINWISIDEPSAHAFITQITKWLQKRHARGAARAVAQRIRNVPHLRLVKEPDRDS